MQPAALLAHQVIEGFGLLSFTPLAIEDRESVGALLALVDKANGYAFSGLARAGAPPPEVQYSAGGAGRPGGEAGRARRLRWWWRGGREERDPNLPAAPAATDLWERMGELYIRGGDDNEPGALGELTVREREPEEQQEAAATAAAAPQQQAAGRAVAPSASLGR